jgi:hypothetical protein
MLDSDNPTASERFYRFVGSHYADVLALYVASIVFAAGCFLAWNGSPIWLNRAGAIIVIIGVVELSRWLPEWLMRKVQSSLDYDEAIKYVAARFARENLGEPLSREQRDELESIVRSHVPEHFAKAISTAKRRMKSYELYLFIGGGTFLHGWGDYVVCLLKHCDP